MRNNHLLLGGGERRTIAWEGVVVEEHHLASRRCAIKVEGTGTKATRLVQEEEKAAGHRWNDSRKQHHVKLIKKDISVRTEDIHNNVKDVERRDTLIQLKEQEIIDNEEELQYRELEEIREKNNLLIMRE